MNKAGGLFLSAVLVLLSSALAWAELIECGSHTVCIGTPNNDRMIGTNSDDDIRGRAGRDLLKGRAGRDVLAGGEDDDDLRGGAGADVLDGGPIGDTPSIDGSDHLDGGGGNDEVRGGIADYLWGRGGEDVLHGARGEQRFIAGGGNDVIYGRGGWDYYFFGDRGDHDTIVDALSPAEDDDGNTLWMMKLHKDVRINLSSDADRPELKALDGSVSIDWGHDAITTLLGGAGDDVIRGNDADNTISALGNDRIYGKRGSDRISSDYPGRHLTIFAGRGDDIIDVQDDVEGEINGRSDVVDCGPGHDEVTYDPLTDTVEANCEVLNPEA